jgi:aminoglycoside 3-N-acetyltransferase
VLSHKFDQRTLTISQFCELPGKIGFTPGAVVMLHSSMDEVSRRVPEIGPIDIIEIAKNLLGAEGTLLMPTFPFQGKQFDYVQQNDTFNVNRTPSRAGLLTEVFRRMPEVERSSHPTHPIAALGKNSHELIYSHHLGTAFGELSK